MKLFLNSQVLFLVVLLICSMIYPTKIMFGIFGCIGVIFWLGDLMALIVQEDEKQIAITERKK